MTAVREAEGDQSQLRLEARCQRRILTFEGRNVDRRQPFELLSEVEEVVLDVRLAILAELDSFGERPSEHGFRKSTEVEL